MSFTVDTRSPTITELLTTATGLLKMVLDDDLLPEGITHEDACDSLARTIAKLKDHGNLRFAFTA